MTDVAETQDADTYRELAPELVRFATGLVGRSDAADVVSSAVLKSLSAPAWPRVANRRAYLYRAVMNEARTWSRRNSQRQDRELRSAGSSTWELPGLRPEVAAAVRDLSVRQRAVIVLTYWADLDPPTVATHLGISEGSVRRHLARARTRLREVLHAD